MYAQDQVGVLRSLHDQVGIRAAEQRDQAARAEQRSLDCVWIADDVLSSFDPAKDFNAIADSQKAAWQAWGKEKIDAEDFNNRALKIDKTGKTEINLSELTDHITMDS